MQSKINSLRQSKNNLKFLGILLFLLILPLIINTPLFSNFFKSINNGNQEGPDNDTIGKPNIYSASNGPPNEIYFRYYKIITIDHNQVSGVSKLTNFPVLISIFDSDLQDETQPDGDDIAFSNGTDWLDHEIELFNQNYNSTHAELVSWVRVPSLSPSIDTNITMYYGNSTMDSLENPTGVWDNNYKGVWHLSELSGGTDAIKDSTSNVNDGTDSGSPTLGTTGQMGSAIDFDGTDDYINCGNDASLDITGTSITVEAWVQLQELRTPPWGAGIVSKDGQYSLFQEDDLDYTITAHLLGPSPTPYAFAGDNSPNTWYHAVLVYDGSNLIVYINGINIDTAGSSGSISSTTNNVYIGRREGITFDGLIDEVRVSDTNRSADWIATQYNNQYNPDYFYSVSNPCQIVGAPPPNEDYFSSYKIITINHTKISGVGSHANFPILISTFDSDLHDCFQLDGADIAFAFNGEWLDHEIEFFNKNYNLTHAKLVAWVRIPSLSTSTDTIIRMYYGNSTMSSRENPTGVWNANYKGVWHLSESSGFAMDSTSYGTTGALSGGVTQGVAGQIDGAYYFDGVDDEVNLDDPADGHVDFGMISFTYSFWVWFDQHPGDYQTPIHKGGTSPTYAGYGALVNTAGTKLLFPISDGNGNQEYPEYSLSFGIWMYCVGVVDREANLLRAYKNGVQLDTVSISSVGSVDSTADLRFSRYYLNGTLDEVQLTSTARSADWIKTEYNNQLDPSSFYSIGTQQLKSSEIQVNAIDLYGNSIPNVNVSMYRYTELIRSAITDVNGKVEFSDIIQGNYNFTVKITSNILPYYTEIINNTSEAILLDKSFHIINLICNISRNIFNLKDVDGTPVDSGWIIVNNGTDLQNCTIDNQGQAIFRWLNTSGYNYTVWYRDVNYNPKNIILASGDILIPNSQINLTVNLTTVNFTVITKDTSQAVSGVILILNNTNTGENIVNLTTGLDGKTIFRWLNSSGISSNYSLNLDFYGEQWQFEISGLTVGMVYEVNFSIKEEATYEIKIDITQGELENYETELISLNPVEFITIEWGSQLKLRVLFNITKAGSFTHLLGPANADSTSFEILNETMIIQSGSMSKEEEKIGRYQVLIKTDSLESNKIYFIKLKAQKSGYSLPSDLVISLFTQKNNLILNQSENDDSIQSVYWLDSVNMSVKSHGKISEAFTIEDSIFKNVDQTFKFSIPDIRNVWNLSKITFNVYNISWNVDISKINITIENPYNRYYTFSSSNHSGWDYDLGTWTGITLFLNKESPTNDNSFKFTIRGSFDDTIDIIANSYFIRDSINIQYSKFNITDEISIFTEREGWAIKNITFQIQNCYDTSTWQKVNLSSLNNLNITTNEGFKYNLDQGYPNGTGILTIDDRIIYPLNNRFLFIIQNSSKILFDAIIKVDYIQEFYQNQYRETLNSSIKKNDIINGGFFQVTVLEKDWISEYTTILIDQISNGTDYFLPSEIAMNITIGGNSYTISDTFPGQGIFSLENFDENTIFTAIIESNQPVNFTLYFLMRSSRTIIYEIVGTLTYILRERPDIGGMVQYNSDLGYYLQTIDTSLIDVDEYTVRFTVSKDHHISVIKDLELEVMNRLTLINGDSEFYRTLEEIYVKDAVNFTFLYTDALIGSRITSLETQFYVWEKYSTNGSVVEKGQGEIFATADDLYILDFDTEMKTVGEYLLIVTLDKDNYDYKNVMILLSIVKREMDYSIGVNFKNNQISVVQGNAVPIEIQLTDPTKGSIPLINATVSLIIKGIIYEFGEHENGTYRFSLSTDNVNAFFTSETLIGIINITKEDYISVQFRITIVVEMEEIFPGMPTFYFFLIIFSILASIGGIVGYRVYKHATIPTFVKKARGMQKAIKGGKVISESLLYRSKEAFVGEIVRDKWVKL
ncbi:MAG: DUF2341 domain-containing protein, partial [Promethearchaeota archaeon]